MSEVTETLKKSKIRTSEGKLEEHCNEVLTDLKRYVIRIRTSGLDSRSYDKEYDKIVDKFYEMKTAFGRITSEYTEDYRISLAGYDNKLYQRYLEENAMYEKEMDNIIQVSKEIKADANVAGKKSEEDKTEEKTDNDVDRLPDEPII